MNFRKSKLKEAFISFNDFLFTRNEKRKGYIRLVLASSIFFYAIDSYMSPSKINLFESENFIEVEVKVENKNDSSHYYIQNNIINPILEQAEIKVLQKQKENFLNFNKFSEDEFKKYILGTLDIEIKEQIDYYLQIEIQNQEYEIKGMPRDVIEEAIISTILYHKAFPNNNLFNFVEDEKTKIIYTMSLLKSVARLETGAFKYDHREFSHTGALGRYQIIATTLASIMLKLKMQGFDFEKIELPYNFNNEKPYNMIQKYTTELNSEYSDKYLHEWNILERNQYFKKNLKYIQTLNAKSIQSLKTINAHLRTENGKSAEDVMKELYFNKYGNFSHTKAYHRSLQIMELMKDPISQGVASLSVLEDIMTREIRKNGGTKKDLDLKEIVEKTLLKYNNDKQITNQLDPISKKPLKVRDIYKNTGIEYFYDILSVINYNKENDIDLNKQIEKASEVDVVALFSNTKY